MSNSSSVNKLLSAFSNEVGAVSRYFVNSKYVKSLGLYKISEKLYNNAIDEMKHVDVLMNRIVSLGGADFSMPAIKLSNIINAEDVKAMFIEDLEIETSVIETLISSISYLEKDNDFVSSGILREILNSEVEHVDWISEQLSLIDLIGLTSYLSNNG